MFARIICLITFFTALGCGLIGGVFFAFSSFVLPALARLPGLQGLSAMQSINVVVLNRSFLGVFLGTAVLCATLAVDAVARWSAPHAGLRLAGALAYLLGSLLITKELNVPWNDALAAVQPHSKDAVARWLEFVAGWSFWNHARTAASVLAAALLTLGASGCTRYWECAPPDGARQSQLPERLSQTRLYDKGDPQQIAAGVQSFTPQFELWSDGAQKRRWLSLPPGQSIDQRDPDNWQFPVGTQLWKEFTVQGVRVETRLLRKIGAGDEDWVATAYVWLRDGSDAVATPNGASNALGTAHDVPAAGQCLACHGGRKSFVLGYSAVQLGYATLPASETDRRALGYLHANCGHCHNQDRPGAASARCYNPENELDFWLRTDRLRSVTDTPTYQSGRGVAFEPGDPDSSRMIELMSDRGFLRQMPPLGTEVVDERGLGSVRAWISTLH
ncbi:MAG: anthrone oxygenase family protein [Myxococcales bacterium]